MNLLSLTAVELGKKIKAHEVTVEEATRAALDAIRAKEKDINSFVTVDEESAMIRAKEVQKMIDDGTLTGPLAVVPVAIKDNMCTKGGMLLCTWIGYRRIYPSAKFILWCDRNQTNLWYRFPLRTDRIRFLSGSDRTDCKGCDRLCHNSGDNYFL